MVLVRFFGESEVIHRFSTSWVGGGTPDLNVIQSLTIKYKKINHSVANRGRSGQYEVIKVM